MWPLCSFNLIDQLSLYLLSGVIVIVVSSSNGGEWSLSYDTPNTDALLKLPARDLS